MESSYRYGDEATASAYPLDVVVEPLWQSTNGKLRATFAIPPCPKAHIIVPSLAIDSMPYQYQCTLGVGDNSWPLEPVPSRTREPTKRAPTQDKAKSPAQSSTASSISTHIDCYHTEADIAESELTIVLDRLEAPARYLLSVSIRPLEIEPELCDATPIALAPPPPLSQKQGPKELRDRICSPTALAMTLQHHQSSIEWLEVVEKCLDNATKMYGSWPMAVYCAAAYHRLGAVEVVTSWTPILRVLNAGVPVVASIRFAAGELPGAPMDSTGGHLVTVYGIEDDMVLVHDPAAPDVASVPRRYPLQAFANAWFRYRGAAYILAA